MIVEKALEAMAFWRSGAFQKSFTTGAQKYTEKIKK
jgi:hypothetical protein